MRVLVITYIRHVHHSTKQNPHKEHEITLIAKPDTLVDPRTVVIVFEYTAAADAAMVGAFRLHG